jgi:hypothetical protein
MKKPASIPSPASVLTILLILAVGVGLGWFAFARNAPTTETVKIQPITEEVVQSFKISSLTYRYTNVIYRESIKAPWGFEIPFTGSSWAVRYDGTMEIGIDGSRLVVTQDGDEITVTLPPVEILSHSLVHDTTELLFDQAGLLNPNKIEDYAQVFDSGLEEMEYRARQSGLIDQARASAEEQLRHFLEALPGMDQYTLIFKDFEG